MKPANTPYEINKMWKIMRKVKTNFRIIKSNLIMDCQSDITKNHFITKKHEAIKTVLKSNTCNQTSSSKELMTSINKRIKNLKEISKKLNYLIDDIDNHNK